MSWLKNQPRGQSFPKEGKREPFGIPCPLDNRIAGDRREQKDIEDQAEAKVDGLQMNCMMGGDRFSQCHAGHIYSTELFLHRVKCLPLDMLLKAQSGNQDTVETLPIPSKASHRASFS
jgi:hypothetical protein